MEQFLKINHTKNIVSAGRAGQIWALASAGTQLGLITDNSIWNLPSSSVHDINLALVGNNVQYRSTCRPTCEKGRNTTPPFSCRTTGQGRALKCAQSAVPHPLCSGLCRLQRRLYLVGVAEPYAHRLVHCPQRRQQRMCALRRHRLRVRRH